MNRWLAVCAILLLVSSNSYSAPPTTIAADELAPATAPSDAPVANSQSHAPSDHRVLIISIDGCRPDVLLRADTPNLHGLIARGTFTMWAQTTAVAVTMPSHVSMLTGARPQIHQIEWNHDIPLGRPIYPAVPTVFEQVHRAGYTTGMVAGKSKFDCLEKPGTIDYGWVPKEEAVPDQQVLQHALQVIRDDAPQLLFVHLPENDKVGHSVGWGSPQQMETLHGADAAIGQILGALRDKGVLDKTLIIVSADHGGAGRQHGADDVRSRCIPWIAVGPGVRQGVDLTTVAPLRTVRTEDTFATTCAYLNVAVDPTLDGKPVDEIFDRRGQELMSTDKPARHHMAANGDATAAPTDDTSVAATLAPAATQPAEELTLRPHAAAQTAPVGQQGDAADDPAVWVNPADPAASIVIGTDKKAGLCTYDLTGKLLQSVSQDTHPDNVDVLYGFPLNGTPTDLAIAATRAKDHLGVKIWAIDPATRALHDVTQTGAAAGDVIPAFGNTEPYGSCVYRSPRTGNFYYFVNNKKGQVEQYELHPADDGKIAATRVRHFGVGSQVEGCVADIEAGAFYLAEEKVGIWKFSAEPDGGDRGQLVAKVGEHGLTADVEGLTLYYGPGGSGYLLASSQGSSTFKVYDRQKDNAFIATIDPTGDQKVDDISDTDGIEAVSCPLGGAFPRGVFIAQDGETPDGRQNFKIYDWAEIAGDVLKVSPGPSPRELGLKATAAK